MSHSYRHTPISGFTCCDSEKQDKRFANRKLRRINKVLIKKGFFDKLRKMRDVSDVWSFGKDGKLWMGDDKWWKIFKRK